MDDTFPDSRFSLANIKRISLVSLEILIQIIKEKLWPSFDFIIIMMLSSIIFLLSYHICSKVDQQLPAAFIQNLYKSQSCSFSTLFDWTFIELTWQNLIQKLNFTAS
jgi:hypothetical protein